MKLPAVRLPRRAPRAPRIDPTTPAAEPLRAQAIHRNLLLADDGLWAWFTLGPVQWSFKSNGDRATILDAATIRWADLAGHRVHLRRTTHPVPYNVWARQLDKATPHPLETPGDPDAPSWADFLLDAQERIAALRMEAPATYIGVRITTRTPKVEELAKITSTNDPSESHLIRVRAELRKVTGSVAKDGFAAKPLSARGLGRLMQASVGLGAPVSIAALAGEHHDWAPEDMDTFTHPVYVSAEPLAKTVQVRALRDGHEHVRHVAVLSVGRMSDRNTENPAFDPWLVHADRLPFPVEWSATFDVMHPVDAAKKAELTRRRAEDMQAHFHEHDETPAQAVARGIRDAHRIEDEITDGEREVAVRMSGPIRCAVASPSETDTLERVAALIDAYAMNEKIALHHGYGQYGLYREFIPGEPPADAGFQRVLPAYYTATAVPNAVTRLGDGEGPYLGRSGHRPVMFDPTWGPRNNQSGLVLVGGGLGSGKSTLAGALAESSVRRGHQTVIFDPSGPLAALCAMPALRAHARHVELSGAEPGTLNPYWLIPEPVRAHHTSDAKYLAAVREAEAERRDLMVDAAAMLLPGRDPGLVAAIESAVNAVGGAYGTNPWRVVHQLEHGDPLAQTVGAQLRASAQMRGARLMFPEDEHARAHTGDGFDARLTVITMRGITTPPEGTSRADWTRAERMAVPVLHLAARYAMRAMYANQEPKTILADEAGIIAAGGSTFRSFLVRGSRDSRKSNTMFGILSQNPGDLLDLAPQITNLAGAAFIGRLKDEEAAAAALGILGVPAGHGYEKALTRQVTGEFLMRDWNGNVDRIAVDLAHRPDLLAALNTTPPALHDTADEDDWTAELMQA